MLSSTPTNLKMPQVCLSLERNMPQVLVLLVLAASATQAKAEHMRKHAGHNGQGDVLSAGVRKRVSVHLRVNVGSVGCTCLHSFSQCITH